MFTIFTIPKSFEDSHISLIQSNSFRSWKNLKDDIEILVIGNDLGVSEACSKFGVAHIVDVKTNQFGTPLLSSAFRLARKRATYNTLVYSNADIIFTQDLLDTVLKIKKTRKYLGLGQRWDLSVSKKLEYKKNWNKLKEYTKKMGNIHKPSGSDYFIFNKDSMFKIPDFAVGRVIWDNWLIYKAIKEGYKVIDTTPVNFVIHQNHDYKHIVSDKKERGKTSEARRNKEIANISLLNTFTIKESNYVLTNKGLVKNNVIVDNSKVLILNIAFFLRSLFFSKKSVTETGRSVMESLILLLRAIMIGLKII